eukprot:CAMPEP_0172819734 /NCGR_PEP_ID=MMETSP1075-20121228/14807_1 /TAXON_ID=2916 /ORGANISM="Ceratium fusus, Strain PA161109" /LENGTH=47 /DNA_ID= /DNA_START= /DNA_END= /DNA_ORIENTATION=
MPDQDIVPHVAGHFDTVQRIECRGADGRHRNLLDCHMIDRTVCELWR